MKNAATIFRLGETTTWLTTIPVSHDAGDEAATPSSPIAIHFVIDNSGSMGGLTREVQMQFAPLVDSAATTCAAACSLTFFDDVATLASGDIRSTEQMMLLQAPTTQGSTNIPAGIDSALQVIERQEAAISQGGKRQQDIHHVLILLTDGGHNSGPNPTTEFPKLARRVKETMPSLQLSVVVVGVTRNSSTAMGMHLKTCLETVPLDNGDGLLQPIYFCLSPREMQHITEQLIEGVNATARGSMCTVSHPRPILVSNLGWPLQTSLAQRLMPNDTHITCLLQTIDQPDLIYINDHTIRLVHAQPQQKPDWLLVFETISQQIDKMKIRKVAANADPGALRRCIEQLSAIIACVDREMMDGQPALRLNHLDGAQRLQQHRALSQSLSMGRELRNQLADAANFAANSSAEQAAFLTGKTSKFAHKALRRAAKKQSGGEDLILDETTELKVVLKSLSCESFQRDLKMRLQKDILTHLSRLNLAQLDQLKSHIAVAGAAEASDGLSLLDELAAWCGQPELELDSFAVELADHQRLSTLARYLNDVFFGGRQSYLSLCSPIEHLMEWINFGDTTTAVATKTMFQSQWEMLLFAGFVAYPITIERSAASQMNPFQLEVTRIKPSLIDSASLCCANQLEMDAYGPEGGHPIKDALILIDPSCPMSSGLIASSRLLGETFTSVTISRDLHMYTGSTMKAALLGQSLLACLQPEASTISHAEIAAVIRRQFEGRAYQCGSCGFGPVDQVGCADLMAHHLEEDDRGAVASNACPSCGWFASTLNAWDKWDGTVPLSLIEQHGSGKDATEKDPLVLEAKMDLVLRIVYTFRKLFFRSVSGVVKDFYDRLARSFVEWDVGLTTKHEIDGLSQVLLAVMASDVIDNEDHVAATFAPPNMLVLCNEVCARAARKRFRQLTQGDEVQSQKLAVKRVVAMLGITKESAPRITDSLFEPEPPRDFVEASCDSSYAITDSGDDDRAWVEETTRKWRFAMAVARSLRASLVRRGGGWTRLEADMETSLASYRDVVEDMKHTDLGVSTSLHVMCDMDIRTMRRSVTAMAAQAYLYNAGANRFEGLPDVLSDSTLCEMARDMRMQIYFGCVQEKMAQWRDDGQQAAFARARVSDIVQYRQFIGSHVHGLNKEMFWGLWEAAKHSDDTDKLDAFLETANAEFHHKHSDQSSIASSS
jgi:uncharacterized protein YegL